MLVKNRERVQKCKGSSFEGFAATYQGSENGDFAWEDRVNGGRACLAYS